MCYVLWYCCLRSINVGWCIETWLHVWYCHISKNRSYNCKLHANYLYFHNDKAIRKTSPRFIRTLQDSMWFYIQSSTNSTKLLREKTFTNFTVLWLYAKVFSTKFWDVPSFGAAKASNPWKLLLKYCISHKLAKVFSLESFPLHKHNCAELFYSEIAWNKLISNFRGYQLLSFACAFRKTFQTAALYFIPCALMVSNWTTDHCDM